MRKLLCLILFLILFVMPGLSSYSNSHIFGITSPDEVPSIDIPTADYIMEKFFKENHFTHTDNTSIVLSSDQFLGIMALLSRYNATKNTEYLNYAENVWNYSEKNFYDDGLDLYSYNLSDDTKYVLDNSYALLANLELYAVTNDSKYNDSKYFERAENVSKKIVSMQMENGFFKISSNNDSVDIKTQAMASFALLETGNISCRDAALSALNATIKKYPNGSYNQSGKYYAIDNAMMTFATAEAYEITEDESFKKVSEKTAEFLSNMSLTVSIENASVFIGVAPFAEKNETGFFTSDYNTTALDQIWSYIALMKITEITGNSSDKEKSLSILDALLLFWDFNNGGFIDGLNNINKTFEQNALTVIFFETPININAEDFYSEVSVVLPKSSWAVYSASYDCYGISDFTVNANMDIRNKTIFDSVSKIMPYTLPYGKPTCYLNNKNADIYLDSMRGKYFFLMSNVTKGANYFQAFFPLNVQFLNMSATGDAITVNFISQTPVSINQTLFFLESNITVNSISVNGRLINNYSITYSDYLEVFINETIEYNNTCFVINYTDNEKPRIDNVRFVSNGEEISEIIPYKEIWVECDAEDNNVISDVLLFYNNGSGWESKEMLDTGNGYRAYFGVFDRDVDVYINATDLSGNTYQSQTYTLKTKNQTHGYFILYLTIIILLILAGLILISRKMLKERHTD